MASSSFRKLQTKSMAQIRDDALRTYSNGLVRLGITAPDVSLGTEIYNRFQAIAQEIALVGANVELKADALMPDSALGENGEDLLRIARALGLSIRPAVGSVGGIDFENTLTSGTTSAVTTGAQLIDPQGLTYRVSVGGSYATDDRIPIESIDTGSRTNLAAGTVLRWTTTPPFATGTVVVSSGGLTGGADEESLEDLRQRVLERYRTPPSGGNAAHVALVAEQSTPLVQKAFVYPAYNGPGTMACCVVGAPTETNKDRDVDSTTVSSTVDAALVAEFPEFVDILTQTVVNEQVSKVSFSLTLTDSDGWLDSVPFPVYASNGYADVTAVTSTTQFAINSDVAPTAGVSRICWLSWHDGDWTVYHGKVLSYTGTGPYTVTVDQPFVGIAVGDTISPDAANIDSYFATVLAKFAQLGPGQKTSVAGLLPRAYRRPLTSVAWPSDINATFLKALTDSSVEVEDAAFLYRAKTTPTTPSAATTAPNILTPKNIAFYPTS